MEMLLVMKRKCSMKYFITKIFSSKQNDSSDDCKTFCKRVDKFLERPIEMSPSKGSLWNKSNIRVVYVNKISDWLQKKVELDPCENRISRKEILPYIAISEFTTELLILLLNKRIGSAWWVDERVRGRVCVSVQKI